VVVLFAAGFGWSLALLPADPILRTTLAPALGAGMTTLAALAWAVARLPFSSPWTAGPLVLTGLAGWALAVVMGSSRPSPRPSRSEKPVTGDRPIRPEAVP
jgi:hypothetical protein